MSAEWYYHDGTKEHGPLLPRQLAELAARGVLRPGHRVRKGADGKWHLASEVKGLAFAAIVQPKPGIAAAKASPPPLPARQEPATHPIDKSTPAIILSDGDTAVGASHRGISTPPAKASVPIIEIAAISLVIGLVAAAIVVWPLGGISATFVGLSVAILFGAYAFTRLPGASQVVPFLQRFLRPSMRPYSIGVASALALIAIVGMVLAVSSSSGPVNQGLRPQAARSIPHTESGTAGGKPQGEPNTQSAQTYLSRGNECFCSNKWDDAIAQYSVAIQLDPRCSQAYRQRGACYSNKGNNQAAAADFAEALRVEGDKSPPTSPAQVAGEKPQTQEVSDEVALAGIDPNDHSAAAYYARGNAYFQER